MVTKYLLDTNVFSERSKSRPNPAVLKWLNTLDQGQVYLSVLTVGELRYGIEKNKDLKRRRELQSWLDEDLPMELWNQILLVDLPIAEKWGYLCSHAPATLPAVDTLLAATALVHNLVVATRNVKHFASLPGVEVLNPWDFA